MDQKRTFRDNVLVSSSSNFRIRAAQADWVVWRLMVVFISSTFRDLRAEREAAEGALRQIELAPWGMEFFVSSPERPLHVCLDNLRAADAVVLIIGSQAGSFIPESSELTYTAVEIEEARKLRLPVFAFILTRNGTLPNDECDVARNTALESLRSTAQDCGTPAYFENEDQLRFRVVVALQNWTNKGRPGSRKTFASPEEYFADYAAPDRLRLIDFSQTLIGRDRELRDLQAFLASLAHDVCLIVGRGGIGKTRLVTVQVVEAVFSREGTG